MKVKAAPRTTEQALTSGPTVISISTAEGARALEISVEVAGAKAEAKLDKKTLDVASGRP